MGFKMVNDVSLGENNVGVLPGIQPVALVTCGNFENANVVAVSYFGQIANGKFHIALRSSRYSNKIIRENQEFTINYMFADNVVAVDYCGIVSGRDICKFSVTNLRKAKGIGVNCPSIEESPLSLECRVSKVIGEGSHDLFIGRVVEVVRRKEECVDWLYQESLQYFGSLKGYLGDVFSLGQKLKTYSKFKVL